MLRELRICPVTGTTVILNERWPPSPPPTPNLGECWACGYSGPTISGSQGVVAVPHPAPVLGIEGDAQPRQIGPGILREGVGAHELVFGPHESAVEPLLAVVRQRMADLRQDSRLRGFSAGCRTRNGSHAIWHLVATPFDVAPEAASRWRDSELAARVRVIAESDGAVAIAAFAPVRAFETWVVPAAGDADFMASQLTLTAVAELATGVAGRMAQLLGNPEISWSIADGSPYRLLLRPELYGPSAPVPFPVVGVFPERAAKVLRGA